MPSHVTSAQGLVTVLKFNLGNYVTPLYEFGLASGSNICSTINYVTDLSKLIQVFALDTGNLAVNK